MHVATTTNMRVCKLFCQSFFAAHLNKIFLRVKVKYSKTTNFWSICLPESILVPKSAAIIVIYYLLQNGTARWLNGIQNRILKYQII